MGPLQSCRQLKAPPPPRGLLTCSGGQYDSQSISIPWKLVEMQILGPYPTATEFKILAVGLSDLCFNKPSRDLMHT